LALLERSQQPVGHELELQTHCPATQARPSPQRGPLPHWQLPPTQLSALAGSHAWQTPPLTVAAPQAMKLVCVISQLDGEVQQPPQPLPPSHTQVALSPLPEQRVPLGHDPPVAPQTQLPLAH